MNTQQQIIDWIGRGKIRDAIGVSDQAISAQLRAGKFPAHWYAAMETLAGRPLPRQLFKFKGDV